MTIVLVTALLAIATVFLMDLRRVAEVRCIERAEYLRIRFSDLRHRLVMHAGSGTMTEDERNAFLFLYHATAFMLRHPMHYRSISDAVCTLLASPQLDTHPPMLRRQDLSEHTRPLLIEYVAACDDLVQQFADPLRMLVAYVGGQSVLDGAMRSRFRRREFIKQRESVEAWRNVGARALGM